MKSTIIFTVLLIPQYATTANALIGYMDVYSLISGSFSDVLGVMSLNRSICRV